MKTLDDIIDYCRCQYGSNNQASPCQGKVELHCAMTVYHFEGKHNTPEDPNKDFYCCEYHYEDYYTFWKEQWDEYYSMIRG